MNFIFIYVLDSCCLWFKRHIQQYSCPVGINVIAYFTFVTYLFLGETLWFVVIYVLFLFLAEIIFVLFIVVGVCI